MHEDEGEGERGTEDGRGEGRGGGGLALRSAMEIPRAYRTRLNVSPEETREGDFSLSSSLPPPPLFATLDHQMRGYRATFVRDASAFFDLCLLLCGYLNGAEPK